MMPKMNGLEVIKILRNRYDTPIIFLTAKISLDEKILGLELGADDYITKPFSMRELLLRIKAILKRNPSEDSDKVISYENIPNILAEKGLSEIKLADGSQVTVKRIVNAYLPKEDKMEERKKALEWLRKNDLGDIIKNDILVSFGQGEDNKAVLFAGLAQKSGYAPTQKMTVHNQEKKAREIFLRKLK